MPEFFDTVEPDDDSPVAPPPVLPSTKWRASALQIALSMLDSSAHIPRYRRFTAHLTMTRARLAERRGVTCSFAAEDLHLLPTHQFAWRSQMELSFPARPSRQQEDEFRRLDDSWQGEQHLPRFLAERLGDEWVLVQGYRNARGEADFILVGPPGVCAIEVKYLNGVVYAKTAGSWWRDKYDNYGNLVETGEPIRDRGGRSPSQQVHEVASELERHLQRRVPERSLGVRTAVILTHDRSRLGKINASVDAVATLSDLKPHHLAPTPSAELSDHEVDEVVTLIAQDHRFHEERREQGSRRRGRRRGKPAKRPRN